MELRITAGQASGYIDYEVTDKRGKVLDSGTINVDGLSADKLDGEIWNHALVNIKK